MESYRVKIKNLEETGKACLGIKKAGGKVVFTNGCFDLLHPGHARYLEAARQMGDHLVVAVNSDQSVKSIKDPGRPILNEHVRAEMVASLGCVDSVLIFDESDPFNVIKYLMPNVLVKGGDWAEEDIIGGDVVKAAGGEIKRIPFEEGFSTTGIINKILACYS